jgi:hypothetical protein
VAERPRPSPRPDVRPELEQDPVTGVLPATRDFVREVNATGLWKTSWALICTAAALVGGTLWAYRAAAQEARDAGVAAAADVKRQADATQHELERFQLEVTGRMKRVEDGQGRTEQKVDKLLERFQVPNPAPAPAPRDGGP